MTDNESSTPGGARGKAATVKGHGDLAELLSAVLNHPDTLGQIINDICGTLCGLRDRDSLTDAGTIRRALRNAGKGGRG